jgi:metallo-beta-lactamase class B
MAPVLFYAALLAAADPAPDGALTPHRIADDLYYVGSHLLASYLVTTPKGHILINADFEKTVPLVQRSVEALGFKMSDVKIILDSHAHDDHVAGTALLKGITGAQVYVMERDDAVVRSGGEGQYLYSTRWKPVAVSRVLHDGDKVTLGGKTLVARRTPGHTRGCTTWTMKARDAGKTLDVVIVGSPNVNAGYRLVGNTSYPEIATDFQHSFDVWRALPCDIFLGAHGAYYGLDAKLARLQKAPGGPNPFIDPQGYKGYIEEREKAFRAELDKQRRP